MRHPGSASDAGGSNRGVEIGVGDKEPTKSRQPLLPAVGAALAAVGCRLLVGSQPQYLSRSPDSRRFRLKKTVQNLLAEYGTVAVIVYFTIFFAVLGGFWLAIKFGWRPSSAAGNMGTLAAAYIATKLTQPIRIAATVVVTPFVAKLYERMRGRRVASPNDSEERVTTDTRG